MEITRICVSFIPFRETFENTLFLLCLDLAVFCCEKHRRVQWHLLKVLIVINYPSKGSGQKFRLQDSESFNNSKILSFVSLFMYI